MLMARVGEWGIAYAGEETEEKWLKHYASFHRILLVAEGNFSFSLSLAMAFGSATNIVASSLDSYGLVIQKYKKAKSNLDMLQRLGASLLFEVDATKMKSHCDLQKQKFDRIIYNFPHAGFYGKEDGIHLVAKHRTLVHHFFRNASGMLRAYGEIHVNHKTTAPFSYWNLEELGLRNALKLIECVDFKIEDYPGYNNKRGSGPRCDEPFPLKKCSTFKFQLSPPSKKIPVVSRNLDLYHCRNLELQRIPISREPQPNSFELMRGRPTNFTGLVVSPPAVSTQGEGYGVFNSIPGTVVSPRTLSNRGESSRVSNGILQSMVLPPAPNVNIMGECFSGYFNPVLEAFGQTDHNVGYFTLQALKYGCKTYMAEAPGRSLTGDINLLQEQLTPRTLSNRGESSRVSNGIPQSMVLPPAPNVNIMGECFSGYFNPVLEAFRQTDHDVGYFTLQALKYGCKTYMAEAPGRSLTYKPFARAAQFE